MLGTRRDVVVEDSSFHRFNKVKIIKVEFTLRKIILSLYQIIINMRVRDQFYAKFAGYNL